MAAIVRPRNRRTHSGDASLPIDRKILAKPLFTLQSGRLAIAGALLLWALALAPSAHAQAGDDLLRAIRPWIKQQLLGGDQAQPDPAVTEETDPQTADPSATASEPAAGAAEAAAEAEPESTEPGSQSATAEEGVSPAAEVEGAESGAPALEATELDALVSEALRESEETAEPQKEALAPLRFGVLAGRSAAVTMATVAPLAEDIGTEIDRPVEFVPMVSYSAMIDAQVERRIDGGFYASSAYVLAEARCFCLEPIVAPRASDGTVAYHAVIVARPGSGIEQASDLAGRTVAVGAADSLGARRLQLAGLMVAGLDPETALGGVYEVDSAVEAVRLVRDRVADAAFAWSSLSGDLASGYSRGTLSQMVSNGELTMDDLVIVWRSPPLTHGPLAVLKNLSDTEKDKISALLLALEANRPAAYDVLNPFYAGGYAPVDAGDFSGLETLIAQNVDALRLPIAAASPQILPAGAEGEESEPQ